MCDSSVSFNKEIIIKDLSKIVNFQFPIVENCPKGRSINKEYRCEAENKGICDLNGGYCTKYNE